MIVGKEQRGRPESSTKCGQMAGVATGDPSAKVVGISKIFGYGPPARSTSFSRMRIQELRSDFPLRSRSSLSTRKNADSGTPLFSLLR